MSSNKEEDTKNSIKNKQVLAVIDKIKLKDTGAISDQESVALNSTHKNFPFIRINTLQVPELKGMSAEAEITFVAKGRVKGFDIENDKTESFSIKITGLSVVKIKSVKK